MSNLSQAKITGLSLSIARHPTPGSRRLGDRSIDTIAAGFQTAAMSEPDVDDELLALSRLSDQFLQSADDIHRSAARIIWHVIRVARHAEQRLEYEVHRPCGWSWAGFRIMINTIALGTVEPGQLATILGVSRPTITSNLDKLERDGFLVRKPAPSDGRSVLVELTERGREAVGRAMPHHGDVESEMVKALDADQRATLENLLHIMLKSLRKGGGGGGDDFRVDRDQAIK